MVQFQQLWRRAFATLDVWVRVWKGLRLSKDFVPAVGGILEESSMFRPSLFKNWQTLLVQQEAIQCDNVYIGKSPLWGTLQKCWSFSNVKNVNLCTWVVNVAIHNYIPPTIFIYIHRLQQCSSSRKCTSPNSVSTSACWWLEDLEGIRAIRPMQLSLRKNA